MTPEPVRIVRCPACGAETVYASTNAFRPFCSERCRDNDLGAWASEAYRIEAAPAAGDDDSDDAPAPPHS